MKALAATQSYRRKCTSLVNRSNIPHSTEVWGKTLLKHCKVMSEYFREIYIYMNRKILLAMESSKSLFKVSQTFKNFVTLNDFLPLQGLFLANIEMDKEMALREKENDFAEYAEKILDPLIEFKIYLDKERKIYGEKWALKKQKLDTLFKSLTGLRGVDIAKLHFQRIKILKNCERLIEEAEELLSRIYRDFCMFFFKKSNEKETLWKEFLDKHMKNYKKKQIKKLYAIKLLSGAKLIEGKGNLSIGVMEKFLSENDGKKNESITFSHDDLGEFLENKNSADNSEAMQLYDIKKRKRIVAKDESFSHSSQYAHKFRFVGPGGECFVCNKEVEFGALKCKKCNLHIHSKCSVLSTTDGTCTNNPLNYAKIETGDLYKLIYACLDHVENNFLHIKGIYRISPSQKILNRFLTKITEAAGIETLNSYPTHVITCGVKKLLNRIPDDLISNDGKESFRDLWQTILNDNPHIADALSKGDVEFPDFIIEKVKKIISNIPPSKRKILKRLLLHIKIVSSESELNEMNIQSLAIVFAPSIFYSKHNRHDANLVISNFLNEAKLTEILIQGIDEFFSIMNNDQSDSDGSLI